MGNKILSLDTFDKLMMKQVSFLSAAPRKMASSAPLMVFIY